MRTHTIRSAQKVVCCAGLCVATLLVVFPPWQEAYKSEPIPYRKDLGHSFILKRPSPVEVRNQHGPADPASDFYVLMDTRGLISECAGVAFLTLVVLFALGMLRTEDLDQARLAWRFATAAALTGLLIEALILSAFFTVFSGGPAWMDWIFTATQEPGWHLMKFIVRFWSPGFETGIGYAFALLFLIQGAVYALLTYFLLSKLLKKE